MEPFTHQQAFSNNTYFWVPPDTKEYFLKNLTDKHRKEYLEKHNWIDEYAISYNFNSQGYRTHELGSLSKNFVALGCSFTFGTGLPQSMIWPEIVSNVVNIPVYNLGVYGAANDTIYRIANYWLSILQPKFVLMLTAPSARIELFDDYCYKIFVPKDKHHGYFGKLYKTYNENYDLNYEKNIKLIQYICDQNNIPLYYKHFNEFNRLDNARDFQHQGPKSHRSLATEFLNMINAD